MQELFYLHDHYLADDRNALPYEAKLYVKNISPVTLEDVTVYDTYAGFQAIQSDYGYAPRVRFDPDTFSSTVMYEIGDLHPGEVKELTVNMSTVLVPPDPCKFDYVIGKKTEVDYLRRVGGNGEARSLIYHVPAAKVIEGWYGTEEIPLNTDTVLAPLTSRDYLVVTHPRNLYSQYQILDVDELLSELAMFVRHKNAVLAYLDTPAPRSERLNLTGHKNAVPINGAPSSGNVVNKSVNGIFFNVDANFWASNRASGNTNNFVNTTGQTDGGGNVGF